MICVLVAVVDVDGVVVRRSGLSKERSSLGTCCVRLVSTVVDVRV